MLLRQPPSTPDPDLYLTMSGTTNPPPPPADSNPSTQDHTETITNTNTTTNNETDSIWGSPSPSPSSPTTLHPNQPHPSDIPRLQHDHTTAGYRDGITAAKSSSVQPGFDEGFSLGATIGARAGELLGVLEGIVAALPSSPRLSSLLEEARRDLSVPVVFGKEFWDGDGTWTYDVPSGEGVVFADVAGAHPVLRRALGGYGQMGYSRLSS
ncbi:hypothetical protein QBC39DRAFT_435639 [Podospora conica]|nr:hypothetical protein QBC39DRAFT_435639 [Schizothecium conicum]